MEWIQSLTAAIDFIEENLSRDISSSDVSAHAGLSSFHFQRTFSLLTGLTLGEYIRNRRLSVAGERLAKGNAKVIDVAYECGYETPESFSKAFRRFHGITPNQANKQGTRLKSFSRLVVKIKLEGGAMLDYRIVRKDAFDVCVASRAFTADTCAEGIPKFWDEYFGKGLQKSVPASIGLCAQERTDCAEFTYAIGCEKKLIRNIPDGFTTLRIPSYTWAIFRCVGSMPLAIQNMWKRIYDEWLPQSSFTLICGYDIESYPEGNLQADDYVSEIWIPVKEKGAL